MMAEDSTVTSTITIKDEASPTLRSVDAEGRKALNTVNELKTALSSLGPVTAADIQSSIARTKSQAWDVEEYKINSSHLGYSFGKPTGQFVGPPAPTPGERQTFGMPLPPPPSRFSLFEQSIAPALERARIDAQRQAIGEQTGFAGIDRIAINMALGGTTPASSIRRNVPFIDTVESFIGPRGETIAPDKAIKGPDGRYFYIHPKSNEQIFLDPILKTATGTPSGTPSAPVNPVSGRDFDWIPQLGRFGKAQWKQLELPLQQQGPLGLQPLGSPDPQPGVYQGQLFGAPQFIGPVNAFAQVGGGGAGGGFGGGAGGAAAGGAGGGFGGGAIGGVAAGGGGFGGAGGGGGIPFIPWGGPPFIPSTPAQQAAAKSLNQRVGNQIGRYMLMREISKTIESGLNIGVDSTLTGRDIHAYDFYPSLVTSAGIVGGFALGGLAGSVMGGMAGEAIGQSMTRYFQGMEQSKTATSLASGFAGSTFSGMETRLRRIPPSQRAGFVNFANTLSLGAGNNAVELGTDVYRRLLNANGGNDPQHKDAMAQRDALSKVVKPWEVSYLDKNATYDPQYAQWLSLQTGGDPLATLAYQNAMRADWDTAKAWAGTETTGDYAKETFADTMGLRGPRRGYTGGSGGAREYLRTHPEPPPMKSPWEMGQITGGIQQQQISAIVQQTIAQSFGLESSIAESSGRPFGERMGAMLRERGALAGYAEVNRQLLLTYQTQFGELAKKNPAVADFIAKQELAAKSAEAATAEAGMNARIYASDTLMDISATAVSLAQTRTKGALMSYGRGATGQDIYGSQLSAGSYNISVLRFLGNRSLNPDMGDEYYRARQRELADAVLTQRKDVSTAKLFQPTLNAALADQDSAQAASAMSMGLIGQTSSLGASYYKYGSAMWMQNSANMAGAKYHAMANDPMTNALQRGEAMSDWMNRQQQAREGYLKAFTYERQEPTTAFYAGRFASYGSSMRSVGGMESLALLTGVDEKIASEIGEVNRTYAAGISRTNPRDMNMINAITARRDLSLAKLTTERTQLQELMAANTGVSWDTKSDVQTAQYNKDLLFTNPFVRGNRYNSSVALIGSLVASRGEAQTRLDKWDPKDKAGMYTQQGLIHSMDLSISREMMDLEVGYLTRLSSMQTFAPSSRGTPISNRDYLMYNPRHRMFGNTTGDPYSSAYVGGASSTAEMQPGNRSAQLNRVQIEISIPQLGPGAIRATVKNDVNNNFRFETGPRG